MDLFNEDYKITKPLRLIELFAGYGSQAMAFDRIGVKYEHHFVCEFDKYAMKSYNAVHGTNFEPTDIRNIHAEDLNITDTDKYTYFMTYSFPCTDLSLAGKQAGMKKGSGTRSGLLWEVERLLTECKELPQVLFMENVPQVIAEKNMPDFMDWLKFLHKKGYSSYYKVLNAKDYGVPQNRERCFMFSFLGDFDYVFPEPTGLKQLLVDVLEDEVDEKYYIKSETAKRLIHDLIERRVIPTEQNRTEQNRRYQVGLDLSTQSSGIKQIANCIRARYDAGIRNRINEATGVLEYTLSAMVIVAMRGRNPEHPTDRTPGIPTEQRLEPNLEGLCNTLTTVQKDNMVMESVRIKQATKEGYIEMDVGGVFDASFPDSNTRRGRVHDHGHVSSKITAKNQETYRYESQYRIRKLTPRECFRLMGVKDDDSQKMIDVNSNTQCYKQAGNSIVVDVMAAMFRKLF